MNGFEVIRDFNQKSLIDLMRHLGLHASPVITGQVSAVQRVFSDGDRRISYSIGLDGETLACMGIVEGVSVSVYFVGEWNNNEVIAPLIRLVPDPSSGRTDNKLVLKFATNVRRGLPFATFRVVIQSFEHAMLKLDRTARNSQA